MKWEPPESPDVAALFRTAFSDWSIDMPTVVAIDTETTGLSFHDEAFCATLAWESDGEVRGYYVQFDQPNAKEFLCMVRSQAEAVVGHNLKFDAHKMESYGVDLRRDHLQWHDTECMAHLLDEHQRKGLKDLAVNILGESDTIKIPATRTVDGTKEEYEKEVPREKWEIDNAKAWAKKEYQLDSVKDVGYHLLPRGTLVPYAIADATWTYRLAQALHPRILEHPDLTELYEREMLLTRTAVYSLEKAGMRVREEYVADMVKVYRKRVLQHELDIERLVGKPVRSGKIPAKEREDYFNPASNDEVSGFFRRLGFSSTSYDAEALGGIPHPLARKLLSYRADKKLLDTYFIGLQRDVGPDGIYHTSLRQHGTVTGRTSAGAERGD